MISFVLFSQASQPSMNFNISGLVYFSFFPCTTSALFSWLIMTGYESGQAIVWIVYVGPLAGAPCLVSGLRSSLLALVIYPQ